MQRRDVYIRTRHKQNLSTHYKEYHMQHEKKLKSGKSKKEIVIHTMLRKRWPSTHEADNKALRVSEWYSPGEVCNPANGQSRRYQSCTARP
jgi:hypothetical protein